ncbi:uncharacterized protein LOC133172160 [Saccostrea echinata]|uniref:uncharacterized protein LOC133172160 n=1 Tax=Saccostrea echinata TaxID=191078 RepID=UPI002A7FD0EF|nr:uncharacterized protein LOC133172160 [Saccostrea echinata]
MINMNFLYLFLIFFLFADRVLGQGIQKTITGCISDNVTLVFDLPVNKSLTVDSYIWYKQILNPKDPSFAKYKVADKNFQIFVDDVKDRLLHNHDDSSQLKNLVLLNVQKSDISKYVLVINYVNVTQQSSEYVLQLSVKDVCFENPRVKDGCVFSTCFTGENGKLTMTNETDMMQTVNGYTVIKKCTKGMSVSYLCCNAAGKCEEQMFKVPEHDKDSNKNGGSAVPVIVGVIIGVLLVIAIVVAVVFFKLRKGKKQESPKDEKGEVKVMLNSEEQT